ncbi:TlpA family protein disulfide reductase [Mucilaginibacter ginkgonis]|uniref:TlpA family protein disulfide reductase n=1 Tax=Mucilaginibacter ginkgonis TaxID=2682091 RepID=A0A6I4I0X8_9SPHI|nr:TlpA disulfide reductase family protein [Mucilaginibacter ginkgonis]QQL48761.1 TlpA family protein disulfide reductase [Mucilaginibacter ginkgonis]
MQAKQAAKRWFTRSNVLNAIFIIVLAVFVLYLPTRVMLMRGLMKIGLFNPSVSTETDHPVQAGDVVFQDSAGKQISLSSLKGKVVFINFWATWCPPCIAELPSIDDLHTKLKDNQNIVFIAVDADADFGRSLPFIAKHGYHVPLFIPVSTVPQSLMGNAIPATVVIDKQGMIMFRHDGAANYSGTKFRDFLTALAAK